MSEEISVFEEIAKVMKTSRLQMPERPKNEDGSDMNPMLPYDISIISSEELGKLYGQFACMCQYAKIRLAVRSVRKAISKRRDKMVRATVRLEKNGHDGDKTAKTEIDPRTTEVSLALLTEEGTELLMDAALESYLIGRDACSREMSRRDMVFRGGG